MELRALRRIVRLWLENNKNLFTNRRRYARFLYKLIVPFVSATGNGGHMLHIKKNFLKSALAVFCMVSMLLFSSYSGITTVYAASGYEYVLLTKYSKTMKIGDEYYLTAITSTGKKPKFSSSDSTVASVNTYGKITAKKAGNAMITAKIANGEASCRVTVEKTVITLSQKSISLENGYTARLKAETSTGHLVTYKSARSSIASVDENGVITAKKPGETTITVTADKTSQTCKVTVKQPTVRLDRTSASFYRKGTLRLSVSSTSKSIPRWKTNKKSVATVDNEGRVTAVKNGTAIITVTVDGVSKTCEVTVKKPKITVGQEQISLTAGETCQPKVTVSSGNKPEYYSSNTNVATVNETGVITAIGRGRAYIYAKEDGTKVRMTVTVKEK